MKRKTRGCKKRRRSANDKEGHPQKGKCFKLHSIKTHLSALEALSDTQNVRFAGNVVTHRLVRANERFDVLVEAIECHGCLLLGMPNKLRFVGQKFRNSK